MWCTSQQTYLNIERHVSFPITVQLCKLATWTPNANVGAINAPTYTREPTIHIEQSVIFLKLWLSRKMHKLQEVPCQL